MSTSIDNRVVQMQFDNDQFEAGISQSLQTLERLDKALDSLENSGGFGGLAKSINEIGTNLDEAFSFRGVAAITTFKNVATDLYNFIKGTFTGMMNNLIPVNFVDQVMTGGFSRAQNIEQAKFQLNGLGVAWEDLAKDINYAVDQTAYGLDAAARAASQLVASGVQYGETFGATGNSPMAKALRGISGLAAMTNSSYEDISQLFTTIAGKGKIQAYELNRFAYRGINIAATLAEEFNHVLSEAAYANGNYSEDTIKSIKRITQGMKVTEADIRDLASDGRISFAMFSEAANAAFGKHATEANKTYSGSLANVRAALSRIGAEFYTPHMENMVGVFNQLRLAINGFKTALMPAIGELNKFDKSITTALTRTLGSHAFNSILESVASIAQTVLHWLNRVNTAVEIVTRDSNLMKNFATGLASIAEKLSKLSISNANLLRLIDIFRAFNGVIELVGKALSTVFYILEPWLEQLNLLGGLVLHAFSLIGKAITTFLDNLEKDEDLKTFIESMREFSDSLSKKFTNAIITIVAYLWTFFDVIGKLGDGVKLLADAIWQDLSKVGINLSAIFKALANVLVVGVIAALATLGFAIYNVVVFFQNLWNTIKSFSWTEFRKNIDDAIKKFSEFINGIIGDAPEAFQDFLKDLKKLGGSILDSVLGFFDNAAESIQTFLDLLGESGIGKAAEYAKGELLGFAGTIGATLGTAFAIAVGVVYKAYEKITHYIDAIKSAFNEGGLAGVYTLFENKLVQIGQTLKGIFDNIAPIALKAISDAFTTAWEALGTFFDSIADTRLGRVVNTLRTWFVTIAEGFNSLIESISQSQLFQTVTKPFTDFFKELSEAFDAGGFSGAIDLVKEKLTELKDSITDFFSVENLIKILGDLGKAFLTLATIIGGAVGSFLSGPFQTLLDGVSVKLGQIRDDIISLFQAISQNNPTSFIGGIIGTLGNMFGLFNTGAEEVSRSLVDLNNAKTLISRKKFYGEGGGNAKKGDVYEGDPVGKLHYLKDASKEAKEFADEAEAAGEEAEQGLNKIGGILGGIITTVSNAAQGIADLLGDAQFGDKLKAALGITLLIAIPQLITGFLRLFDKTGQAVATVGNTAKGFLGVIKGLISSVGAFFKGTAAALKIFATLGGLTKLLGGLTAFVAVFTGAMYVIGKMTPEEMNQAKDTLMAALSVVGVLLFISTVLSAVSSSSGSSFGETAKATQKVVNNFVQTVGLMIGAAVATYALVKAFEILKNLKLDWQSMWVPLTTLGFILAGLVAAITFMSKFAPKLSKGALSLLVMGLALRGVIKALVDLTTYIDYFRSNEKIESLNDAFNGIIVLMMSMAVLSAAAARAGAKGGIGLLAIMGSLLLLEKVFETLSTSKYLNFSFIKNNWEPLIVALGTLSLIFLATRLAGKNAIGAGVAMLAISVSVGILAKIVSSLSHALSDIEDATAIEYALHAILDICIGLSLIMVATKAAGAKAALAAFGINSILIVSGALFGLIALLSKSASVSDITKAMAIFEEIALVAGLFSITVALASRASKTGTVVALFGVMALAAGSLITIAKMFPGEAMKDVEAAAHAIQYTVIAIGGLAASIKNIDKGGFAELVGIAVILGAVSYALYKLADFNYVEILSAAASLSLVLVAVTGIVAIVNKLAKSKEKSGFLDVIKIVGEILALSLALTGIAYAINILRSGGLTRGFQDDILPAVVGLVAIVGTLAVLAKAIEGATWTSLLELGVMAVAVGVIAQGLSHLAGYDWTNIVAAAGGVAGVAVILAAIAKACEKIDVYGFVALVIIAGFIGVASLTLAELAKNDWTQIVAAAGMIAVLAGVLAGISAIMAGVGVVGMLGLVVIAAVIAASALTLAQITQYPWEQIVAAAAGLAGAILAVAVAGLIGTAGIVGLVGIALTIGTIAVALLAFAPAAESLASAIDSIITSLTTFADWFKNNTVIGSIGKELQEIILGTDDGEGLSALPGKIAEIGGDIVDSFVGGIQTAIESAGSLAKAFIRLVMGDDRDQESLSGLPNKAKTKGAKTTDSFAEGLQNESSLAKVNSAVDTIGNSVVGSDGEGETGGSGLSGFVERAKGCGRGILEGFLQGLQDSFLVRSINDITSALGLGAVINIHDSAGCGSPSWITRGTGQDIDMGLILGLLDDLSLVTDTAGQIGDGVVMTIYDTTANNPVVDEAGRGIVDTLVGSILESGGELESAGSTVVSWLGNTILDGFSSLFPQLGQAGEEAGEITLTGLMNGFSDPSIISQIFGLAEKLGYGTTLELVEAIANGSVTVEQVCGELGIDMTSSLGIAIDKGMKYVKNSVVGHIADLKKMIGGIGGIFGKEEGDGKEGWLDKAKGSIDELLNSFKNSIPTINDFSGGLEGAGKGAGSAAKSTKDAEEAAKKHAKAVELQNKTIEEFVKVYGVAYESLGETAALDAAREAIHEMAVEYAKAGEDIEVTEEEIEAAFIEMYDNIKSSVEGAMDMFSKFKAESSISGNELIKNMRSNIEATEDWASSLQRLAARGFTKGLVEELANAGPSSIGKIRSLLKMDFGQMIETNTLWNSKNEAASKAAIKALSAMAYAGKTTQAVLKMAEEASGDITTVTNKNTLEIAAAIDRIDVTYKELYNTVEDVVSSQLDLFTKFDKKTETSASDMLENMQSQVEGAQDWANGLSVLFGRGLDQGLIDQLAAMGPKGYDALNAFVQMTEDQIAAANAYYQQSLTLPQTVATQVSTSYLGVATNGIATMIQGMAQGQQEVNAKAIQVIDEAAGAASLEASGENVVEIGRVTDETIGNSLVENDEVVETSAEIVALDAATAANDKFIVEMDTVAYNACTGLANGLYQYADIVATAAAELGNLASGGLVSREGLDENSPSKRWLEYGKLAVQGLANGLHQYASIAVDEATNLGDSSSNAMSLLQDTFGMLLDDNLNLDPTIRPVLDLTDVEAKSALLQSMFGPQAMDMVSNMQNVAPMNSRLLSAINGMNPGNQTSFGNISVTVNATTGADPYEIGEQVSQAIYRNILSREAVMM